MPVLNLYSERDNEVQEQAGLNWGLSTGHVNEADAYIAISIKFLRDNPGFFSSQGSEITVIWDDEVEMTCLLEGTQDIDKQVFPKQISTSGDKSVLGVYLRKRLGVSSTKKITRCDLKKYGRENIEIIFLGGATYKFDFSL